MAFNNSTNISDIEPWYIPTDIVRIIFDSATIGISCILLALLVSNRVCRTVPMLLTANTCLTELLCACVLLSMAVFTLENDIKQVIYEDSLCVFRGYLLCSVTVGQNYSYALQAIYRYMTVVYPSRVFWQSFRFQMCLISISWIFALIVFIPLVFIGQLPYNADNQICHPHLGLSFGIIYTGVLLYVIPNIFINIVYSRLVRYVREMNKRVIPANIVSRAERELKMVKNITTITTILGILGLPFAILIFMSFFTAIPKYHFRIAFIGVDISTTAVTIAIFKTTDSIRTAVSQKLAAVRGTVITNIAENP